MVFAIKKTVFYGMPVIECVSTGFVCFEVLVYAPTYLH